MSESRVFRPIAIQSLELLIDFAQTDSANSQFVDLLIESDSDQNNFIDKAEFLSAVNKFTSSDIQSLNEFYELSSSETSNEWKKVVDAARDIGYIDDFEIEELNTEYSSALTLLNVGDESRVVKIDPDSEEEVFLIPNVFGYDTEALLEYLKENGLTYVGITGNALTDNDGAIGFFATRSSDGKMITPEGKDLNSFSNNELRSGYYSILEDGKVSTYAFYPGDHEDPKAELEKLMENPNVQSISLGALGSFGGERISVDELQDYDLKENDDTASQTRLNQHGESLYLVFDENDRLLGSIDSADLLGQDRLRNLQAAFPEHNIADLYLQEYDRAGFNVTHINGADESFNTDGDFNNLFSTRGGQILVRRSSPEEAEESIANLDFDIKKFTESLVANRRNDLLLDLQNSEKVIERYGEVKGALINTWVRQGLAPQLVEYKLSEEFADNPNAQEFIKNDLVDLAKSLIGPTISHLTQVQHESINGSLKNEDESWEIVDILPKLDSNDASSSQSSSNPFKSKLSNTSDVIQDSEGNLKISESLAKKLLLHLVRESNNNPKYVNIANTLKKGLENSTASDGSVHINFYSHQFRENLFEVIKSDEFQVDFNEDYSGIFWQGTSPDVYVTKIQNHPRKRTLYSLHDIYLDSEGKRIHPDERLTMASLLIEGLGTDWFDQNSQNDTLARQLLEKIIEGEELTEREIRQIAHAIKGDKGFRNIR